MISLLPPNTPVSFHLVTRDLHPPASTVVRREGSVRAQLVGSQYARQGVELSCVMETHTQAYPFWPAPTELAHPSNPSAPGAFQETYFEMLHRVRSEQMAKGVSSSGSRSGPGNSVTPSIAPASQYNMAVPASSPLLAPPAVVKTGPAPKSRFQQLLQAKLDAEKTQVIPTPTASSQYHVDEAFARLSHSETVFNSKYVDQYYHPPSFAEQRFSCSATGNDSQPVPRSTHLSPVEIPSKRAVMDANDNDMSAAVRSVVSERIATMFASSLQGGWATSDNQVDVKPRLSITVQEDRTPETWRQTSFDRIGPEPFTPQRNDSLRPLCCSRQNDRSPYANRSATPTPDLLNSATSSHAPLPVNPVTPRSPTLITSPHPPSPLMALPHGALPPFVDETGIAATLPRPAQAAILHYGSAAFMNMNGAIQVPGMYNAASHGDDGSLGMNGLGGDGNGGYGGDYGGNYGGSGGDYGGGDYGGNAGEGSGGGGGHDGNNPNGNGDGDGNQPPLEHGQRSKKLALACHFCRRRKLKCDGQKPSCDNCLKRGETCSYDEVVRRRGPGKRTKEMRQRAMHDQAAAAAAIVAATGGDVDLPNFGMLDPQNVQGVSQVHLPDADPNNLGQHLDLHQHHHNHHMQLQDGQVDEHGHPHGIDLGLGHTDDIHHIDPMIDPALAMLGMGTGGSELDLQEQVHDSDQLQLALQEAEDGSGEQPATLAEIPAPIPDLDMVAMGLEMGLDPQVSVSEDGLGGAGAGAEIGKKRKSGVGVGVGNGIGNGNGSANGPDEKKPRLYAPGTEATVDDGSVGGTSGQEGEIKLDPRLRTGTESAEVEAGEWGQAEEYTFSQ